MPDFTDIDKTMLVTVLSAAVTFIIVLAAGLTLLKNKNRTRQKRQNKRGGKGWQNSRQFNRKYYWKTFRSLRGKALVLLLLFAVMGIMRYTTPDYIHHDSRQNAGVTTQQSKNKRNSESRTLFCNAPYIIDGDTFDCIGTRIRLMGIDAPEMPDHCRPGRRCTKGDPFAARKYLQSLATGRVKCRVFDIDHYGRSIARCEAGDTDLSCAMIASGHAVRRYSRISCP